MELGFLLRMTKLPFPRGVQHRSRREAWEVKDLEVEGASVAHNQEQDPTADSQSLGGQIWTSGSDSTVPPAGRPSQAENRGKDQWVSESQTENLGLGPVRLHCCFAPKKDGTKAIGGDESLQNNRNQAALGCSRGSVSGTQLQGLGHSRASGRGAQGQRGPQAASPARAAAVHDA